MSLLQWDGLQQHFQSRVFGGQYWTPPLADCTRRIVAARVAVREQVLLVYVFLMVHKSKGSRVDVVSRFAGTKKS